MDKEAITGAAEAAQAALEDVILASVLVEDALDSEFAFGRTANRDYAKYAMAGVRVLRNELRRIYSELTAGIDAEYKKRKG